MKIAKDTVIGVIRYVGIVMGLPNFNVWNVIRGIICIVANVLLGSVLLLPIWRLSVRGNVRIVDGGVLGVPMRMFASNVFLGSILAIINVWMCAQYPHSIPGLLPPVHHAPKTAHPASHPQPAISAPHPSISTTPPALLPAHPPPSP